ncbi:MAG: AMP-binding protein [Colwellia sp.]|nr:AMP-binding protein [Colwellia sp.]
MTEVKTPLEMFYLWEKTTPNDVFLRQSLGNGNWQEYTWLDVGDKVRRITQFIHSCNLPNKSNIALWSSNSADWILVDLAIMLSGHISLPLYPGQSIKSTRFILSECDISLMFIGACGQEDNIDEIISSQVTTVAMLGCTIATNEKLPEIYSDFTPYTASYLPEKDDLFTIVYSSGTTSDPKGVMHTHGTAGAVSPGTAKSLRIETYTGNSNQQRARLFSFLPLSHMAERAAVEFTGLYANACISFSAGIDSFQQEITSVQPTFFFAVPRLWVKFKAAVDAKIPAAAQQSLTDADKNEVRQMLGLSKATMIITGSASLAADIHNWYLDMGIVLREAYGLTETFATGTIWLKNDEPKAGIVGTVSNNDVEIKLSEQNEILIRGKGIMAGYYKNEQKTRDTHFDGWFHTGDLGSLDDMGNLAIKGRIGEEFKTSKGKFIHPAPLENKFKSLNQLDQFVIFGQGLAQPVLVGNLSEMGKELSEKDLTKTLIGALDKINIELPHYEQISHIMLSSTPWTIENGLLTPTLKLQRKSIEKRYYQHVCENIDEKCLVQLPC